jgi:hypothetical protein
LESRISPAKERKRHETINQIGLVEINERFTKEKGTIVLYKEKETSK